MTGLRILFTGSAADYRSATGGEGCLQAPFLFFCPVNSGDQVPPGAGQPAQSIPQPEADVQLLPFRLYFARMAENPPQPAGCPILVSGPASAMAEALACGCADYLVEPWSDAELLARAGRSASIVLGGQLVRLHGSQLHGPEAKQRLGTDEAYLLRLLLANRQAGVSRQHLASLLHVPEGGRAVDMRISRLRRCLHAFCRNLPPGWLRARRGSYFLT